MFTTLSFEKSFIGEAPLNPSYRVARKGRGSSLMTGYARLRQLATDSAAPPVPVYQRRREAGCRRPSTPLLLALSTQRTLGRN